MQANTVIHCHNELGEGPLWHPIQKRLYWLDILKKKVQCLDPETGNVQEFQPDQMITALGLRDEDTFIAACKEGLGIWNKRSNAFQLLQSPEEGKPNARFNDGKVDRGGRFWAGTMTTTDASSTLYRLGADHQVTPMVPKVTISNGLGWSPDDRYMYYADTLRYTIYRYDFDVQTGAISNKCEFVRLSGQDGAPDGLTVDAQGVVWVALWGGWRVERYSPEGIRLEQVRLPVAQPSSVAFGGADMDTLYITSAREGLSQEALCEQPEAGNLFACQPGVVGLPEPFYAG